MPKKTIDRRVQRTRQLLQKALSELILEKDYEKVTVQDVIDRANVGRSTFYAHFQDKDQLLHSILDYLNELFEQHKERVLDVTKKSGNVGHMDAGPVFSPTLSLFQFVGQNHRFFKAMLGNRGYGIFAKPIYDYVFAHIHGIFTEPVHTDVVTRLHGQFNTLRPRETFGSLESAIAAHYFVSALMGILVWWVEKDMPCSAEEIDRLFRELAMPGFRHVLAANHET